MDALAGLVTIAGAPVRAPARADRRLGLFERDVAALGRTLGLTTVEKALAWVQTLDVAGAYASSGGMFSNHAVVQGVEQIVPVDVYVQAVRPARRR